MPPFLLFHHLIAGRLTRCPFRRFQIAFKYFKYCPASRSLTHMRKLSMDGQNKQDSTKPLSEEIKKGKNEENLNLLTKSSRKSQLKQAVRDYGATVVVFHVCISLASFGLSYAVVSSGLDVVGWLTWLGVDKSIIESRLATGGTTFVVAYALYKAFVPVRVFCTLTASPFIVKYLRRTGFIKHAKSN